MTFKGVAYKFKLFDSVPYKTTGELIYPDELKVTTTEVESNDPMLTWIYYG